MAGDPLLVMKNVTIEGRSSSGWSKIVSGIDLRVNRGEVLGLIGESGAGKSSLGLAAMGFVRDGCRFAGGSIKFDGQELIGVPDESLRRLRGHRIAYVAQSAAASFNPAHRLIDQFTEMPRRHGVKSRKLSTLDGLRLYESLRLPNPKVIARRFPHQVSGGQLQRAMTAMAMSCAPDLIVFDEPTTALDVTTQLEVLAAIREVVNEHGTAAIYISHDLAVVAQMADRTKVLLRGEEVEEADTSTMLDNPEADYTKSLWAVRNFVRERQIPTNADAQPVVSIRDVSVAYGTVEALSDISIDFHPGRTVAVVGESGSGKSTTARVIAGLLPAKTGQVLLNGVALDTDFRKRTKDQLRQIQMIYQMADTALNPKIRVRETVGYPAQFYLGLRGSALEARVQELLSFVGLEPREFIDRLPTELSGGQKQRVGIARALAADPSFVICDEIISALDQIVAEGILVLLDRLQTELNLSLMFITHDIATVRAVADDVVIMQTGRIVESGAREQVLSPPHQPYTETLLGSVPEMDTTWLTRRLTDRGLSR